MASKGLRLWGDQVIAPKAFTEERGGRHTTADLIVPTYEEWRTVTLSFGADGDVTRPNAGGGTAPIGSSIDEERIYEVRLQSILINGLSTPTIVGAIQFQLSGKANLPHNLGYGPGQKHSLVTLLGTDFTVPARTTYDKLILSSSLDGKIVFGPTPTIEMRDSETGEKLTWTRCYIELRVLYKHYQKTQGGMHFMP